MGHRIKILSLLASLASVGIGASYAQSSVDPEATFTPLDIVGVKLGMTPDQVRAVLRQRKFPTHEFSSTLSYIDSSTRQLAQVPNGIFLNAIVQAAPAADKGSGDSLTVFFSPSPGNERVVAVSHYNNYPRGKDVHEADLKQGLAEKYGALPQIAAPPQNGFEFSHVWSIPSHDEGAGKQCRFNLIEHLTQAGWWNVNGASLQNYVIGNKDLIMGLVKKKCGPSIVEVNWADRDSKLPAEQRLLEQTTVSIISLPLAYDSIMTASRMVADIQDGDGQTPMRRVADKGKPEL